MRTRRPPRPGALTELPPLKILTQILILQSIWYLVATALILFTALVAGKTFSVDLVLNWNSLRGDTTVGWMLGFVWILNSFIGICAIMFFIHRSKLVLDFALTLHFIHLVLTSLYSQSIPQNTLWWLLQIVSAVGMTLGGTAACQWLELRPISFGGTGANATQAVIAPPSDGDEEQGFGRGRGRGRGRDGAGEYEMVTRSEAQEAEREAK